MLETKKYFKEDHFVANYKRLTMAKFWLDTETGERVKLTHNLKAVYHYRLEQYVSFAGKGCIYHESHQTVADKLALDVDTVKKVIHPLLVRMGLIEIISQDTRHHKVYVYNLKFMKGKLINDKLSKHHKKQVKDFKDKDPVTYEQLKTIRANQEKVKAIQRDLKQEIVVMTKEEFNRVVNGRTKETEE